MRTALRGGVFDYILKPLVFERLEEAVNRFCDHVERLSALKHLGQDEVDALLPRKSSENGHDSYYRLPKGIDVITLDRIRGVIADGKPWSAEEVGAAMGASRTTARRYRMQRLPA